MHTFSGFSLTRLDASLTHQNRPGRTVSQSGASPGRVQITPVCSCKLCNQWHWVQIYWLKKPFVRRGINASPITPGRSYLSSSLTFKLTDPSVFTQQLLKKSSIKSIHRIYWDFYKKFYFDSARYGQWSLHLFMTRPDVHTSYPPVFDSKIY